MKTACYCSPPASCPPLRGLRIGPSFAVRNGRGISQEVGPAHGWPKPVLRYSGRSPILATATERCPSWGGRIYCDDQSRKR